MLVKIFGSVNVLFVSVNNDETYFEINVENASDENVILKSMNIYDIKYYNNREAEYTKKVVSLDDRIELSPETAKFIIDNNLL